MGAKKSTCVKKRKKRKKEKNFKEDFKKEKKTKREGILQKTNKKRKHKESAPKKGQSERGHGRWEKRRRLFNENQGRKSRAREKKGLEK